MVANEKWFGASADFYSVTIDQSLRSEDGDNPRLYTTPDSAGNRKTWTLSIWFKRANLSNGALFSAPINNSTNGFSIYFDNNELVLFEYKNTSQSSSFKLIYDGLLRDTTNWYHLVAIFDTDSSGGGSSDTGADARVRMYLNGKLIDVTLTGSIGADYQSLCWNNTYVHEICNKRTTAQDFDGYIAEVNFLDGTAVSHTQDGSDYILNELGEMKNGVWIPKDVSGLTYGTNGFRLDFSDNTDIGNNTKSTDGTMDFSINGFLSSDVLLDSPTNNYATMNVLLPDTNTYKEGNLNLTATTQRNSISTIAMPSGKWYAEVRVAYSGNINTYVGVFKGTANYNYPWQYTRCINQAGGGYATDTSYSGSGTYGTFSNTDVLGIYYDASNGQVKIQKSDGSGGVTLLATITDSNFVGEDVFMAYSASIGSGASGQADFNFGQNGTFNNAVTAGGNSDDNNEGDFFLPVPSGFLALCASNLSDTNLSANQSEQPTDHLSTITYNGNGTSQSITGVGFQPDWVWAKTRNDSSLWHFLLDSSRGGNARLYSNGNGQETSSVNNITSFDADGFSVGSAQNLNKSSEPIIAWNWKVGGTTPSKTYKVVVVSDSGNKYRFRNSADSATFAQSAVTLDLQEGGTYTFDLSDSTMSGHPLRFSTTSDGTHGGGSEYTTGVTTSGTAGSSGATVTITVASSAPTLYYYCSNHSGMGGQIDTNSTHGSTNFDGTILSVAQANTTSGISILTYTGTGTQSDTVGHSLGVKPNAVIVKSRSEDQNWHVYHEGVHGSAPWNYQLTLNSYNDRSSSSSAYWGGNTPTTTVMGVGDDNSSNKLNQTYVMYLFNEVERFSKFGSYYSAFSTNGNYIHCGFRPQWLMIKAYAGVADAGWIMYDDVRGTENPTTNHMFANYANAETTNSNLYIDFLSNGFKIRGTNTNIGGSGDYYVFFAFARQDFKFSNAR